MTGTAPFPHPAKRNPAGERLRRRAGWLGFTGLCLAAATALTLTALEDQVSFFYSPSDIAAELSDGDQTGAVPILFERSFRIGGLVAADSVRHLEDGLTMEFLVTDERFSVPVRYSGIVPDLFREGQGVVARGRLSPDGSFEAEELLAKHDESYMPPEVADALRRAAEEGGASGRLSPSLIAPAAATPLTPAASYGSR